MEKFQIRYGISSELQERILSYIIKHSNVNYDVLAIYCNRNRRTIGQSVNTLEKNFYLEKHRVKERKNRSKFIVYPTFKGICFGLVFLNIDFLEFLKAHGNENEPQPFFEYIEKIRDYNKCREFIRNAFRLYFEHNLFDQGIPTITKFNDALKEGMKIGSSSKSDETDSYFTEQGIKIASQILPPRELHDLKNFYIDFLQYITKEFTKEIKGLD